MLLTQPFANHRHIQENTTEKLVAHLGPIYPVDVPKTLELSQADIVAYLHRARSLGLIANITLDPNTSELYDPHTAFTLISDQLDDFLTQKKLVLPTSPNSFDQRKNWGILKPAKNRGSSNSEARRRFQWASDVQINVEELDYATLLRITQDPLLRYPQQGSIVFFGQFNINSSPQINLIHSSSSFWVCDSTWPRM